MVINYSQMVDLSTKLLKKDFIVFILIYASYADYEFSINEINQIQKQYGQDVFDKMHELFKSMTEFGSLNFIMSHKNEYFQSKKEIEELLNKIKDQFYSDGDYSGPEKNLFNFLSHLLEETWV